MSEKKFVFTLVTPEVRLVKPTDVVSVTAFGQEGAFTALPGHTPFLTPLKEGTVVKYMTAPDAGEEYYVDAGIIEVLPDRVSVLAESANKADELPAHREREEARRKAFQERLEKNKKEIAAAATGTDAEKADVKKKLLEIGELEIQIHRSIKRIKFIEKKTHG
ncbi:MAG: ATP synthase F1 subunit epsilon [Deltaproteobacteria bacterium]|jgi:F-type H+-transporting ATPase subunit epsilon|nr:ATP synthase F1 subunit epsilon [Deltaproteobacteria bacterium]